MMFALVQQMGNLFNSYEIETHSIANKFIQTDHCMTFAKKLHHAKPHANLDHLSEKLNEIFWTMSETQLELGYMLIALEDIKKQGEKYSNELLLGHMMFNHHNYMALECMYRVWERLSKILCYIFFPENEETKEYFNTIVEQLIKENLCSNNTHMPALKKLMKHQNNIASARNIVSHESSNLSKGLEIFPVFSNILDDKGNSIPKHKMKLPNYKQNLENVKNAYNKANEAINIFFELLIEEFNLTEKI